MEITNFLYGIIMISLISLVILIAYTLYFYYKYFTRENPLPGPFPLPLIGNTHQIFKNFSLDLKELDKYGDLCEFYMGTERIILLGNDDLIQKMMKPVINGPFQNRVNDDVEGLKEIGVLNTGLVFNNNYDEWKFHRKFFTKVMMSSSFIEQSVTAVQDSFSEMEKYWEKLGNTIEFNYWMKRYFFDALFITTTSKPAYASVNYYNEITQNEKSDVPESILKESNMFIESADLFIKCLVYFFLIPKVIRNFPGINRLTRYLKDRIGWLKNNVHAIVKSKREEISKTPIDQELKSDMLTMFLTVNTERDITEKIADDLNDKPMSDKDIVANFIEVLSIGIDTVSNSMCFLVNFLENNPKVKQRMIEEIESVLGKDPNSIITSKDLSKLEYVEATIKEASRLRTVVPMNFKKNSVPEVIGNYKWSKDTNFLLYYDRIQKNSSHWKDSNTFNPDRFIDNNNSNNKYQSLTFGGGMRVCPGRSLAMNELKVTLTMLYRKYDIEQIGPIKDHIMTIRSCDELKVRLKKKTCNKQ